MTMTLPFAHYNPDGSLIADPKLPRDFIAPEVRTTQKRISAVSQIGTRVLGGRTANSAGVLGNTFHVMARMATEYDLVQLIFENPTTADVINCTAIVLAGGSTSDPLQSAGTWTPVTFSGASSVTLPLAADANNPTITLSDWIPLKGDATKLLSARLYIPSAGNTTCPVYSIGTVTGWETVPNREWISRYQAGDFVTTPATMNSATQRNNSAIVGFRYISRGVVHTVMGIGDSIVSGNNNEVLGVDAYWVKACRELLAEGFPVEICNMGWSGQTTAQVYTRALTILQTLKAPIISLGLFSPNDGAPTTASDLAMRGRAALLRNTVADAGGQLLGVTGIPRALNAGASNWTNGQDELRKLFNREMVKTLPYFCDIDAVLANSQELTPASWFAAGLTNDFIHPNNAGDIVASVPYKQALKELIFDLS